MKQALFIVLAFMLFSGLSAYTLFVVDEYTGFNNYVEITQSLTRIGLDYQVYNIAEEGVNPSLAVLSNYLFVIWYCSYSGSGLGFWMSAGMDNPDLISYLNNGGKLWVIGTDLLYDRYGSAPDTFAPGSFPYDYLGISSYNCQSHADDGNTGLPELDPVANPYISGIPVLHWTYPTSWYVDGLTPTASASSIYAMGPASYLLSGNSSAILNHPEVSAADDIVLGFYFDPFEIGTSADRDTLFYHVVDYFRSTIVVDADDEVLPQQQPALSCYPNPFRSSATIKFSLSEPGLAQLNVYNLKGQLINTLCAGSRAAGNNVLHWDGRDSSGKRVPAGIYLLKLNAGKHSTQLKVMLID